MQSYGGTDIGLPEQSGADRKAVDINDICEAFSGKSKAAFGKMESGGVTEE